MADFRRRDSIAAGKLVNLFYPELRRLAGERMGRERPGHSWEPTVLVNEFYLRLVKIRALRLADAGTEQEHQAFLRLAAHIMKRLLIEHARPLSKRSEKTPRRLGCGIATVTRHWNFARHWPAREFGRVRSL